MLCSSTRWMLIQKYSYQYTYLIELKTGNIEYFNLLHLVSPVLTKVSGTFSSPVPPKPLPHTPSALGGEVSIRSQRFHHQPQRDTMD